MAPDSNRSVLADAGGQSIQVRNMLTALILGQREGHAGLGRPYRFIMVSCLFALFWRLRSGTSRDMNAPFYLSSVGFSRVEIVSNPSRPSQWSPQLLKRAIMSTAVFHPQHRPGMITFCSNDRCWSRAHETDSATRPPEAAPRGVQPRASHLALSYQHHHR